MSKGSYRRKADIPKDKFDESFDKIFHPEWGASKDARKHRAELLTNPERKPTENGKKR